MQMPFHIIVNSSFFQEYLVLSPRKLSDVSSYYIPCNEIKKKTKKKTKQKQTKEKQNWKYGYSDSLLLL